MNLVNKFVAEQHPVNFLSVFDGNDGIFVHRQLDALYRQGAVIDSLRHKPEKPANSAAL
jgi:hypothetical protein